MNFVKFDDDEKIVFGWFSVIEENGTRVIDNEGELIKVDELEKAVYDFVIQSRSGGLNHVKKDIGILVESIMFTKEKQEALGIDLGKIGWWGGFKIHSDEVWKSIKDGTLKCFSIGGSAQREAIV